MSNFRWEPMREVMSHCEAMNQMFDNAFTHHAGMPGFSHQPAVDLYQTPDNVVVKVDLPGMKAEDVQISIAGDLLTLRSDVKQEAGQKDVTYHIRERRIGPFERTVKLPTQVKSDAAKAEFEDGILTITLPKTETVKPQSIHIGVK